MSENKQPAEGALARFEAALAELEDVVARLERGELKLEESLKLFERGVELTKACQQSLESAELKVKQLLENPPPSGNQLF